MTTAEMVTRLNTLLNQTASSSTHWTTNMYYEALSAGQRATASFVNKNNPNSSILIPLLKYDAVSSGFYKVLPDDFGEYNTARYAYDGSTYKTCRLVEYDAYMRLIENSYLTPSKNTPVIYFKGGTSQGGYYYFFPSNGSTSNGEMYYISLVTDIDASTEPILKENAHEAIIMYALYTLRKREKDSENLAQATLQQFELMAGAL